jgi:hypothetical protein
LALGVNEVRYGVMADIAIACVNGSEEGRLFVSVGFIIVAGKAMAALVEMQIGN